MDTHRMGRTLAVVLSAGLGVSVSHAQQVETSWTGALNNMWDAPGNWTNGVPDNGSGPFTFGAVIGAGTMFDPVLDSDPVIDRLNMDTGTVLGIENSRVLGVVASAVPMNAPGGSGILNVRGTILLNGTTGVTGVRAVGPGALVLGDALTPGLITTLDAPVNRITGNTSDGQLVVFMDALTFRGSGSIGTNNTAIENRGAIIADQTNDLLVRPGDGKMFRNSGLVRAESGALLQIDDAEIDNTGGIIVAAASSEVNFTDSTSVLGGTLDSEGDGVLHFSGIHTLDGVSVSATANVVHENGRDITLRNGLTLNGDWLINGSTGSTILEADGTQSVSGVGEIRTLGSDSGVVTCVNDADELTLTPTMTFRGSGELIRNTGTIINQGSVIAEGVSPIVIDPGPDAPSRFENLGTLSAVGAGGIWLDSGLTVNTGRTIEVGPGSALDVRSGAVLDGGTIQAAPSATVTLRTCELRAVTMNGGALVSSPNSQRVTVIGGIVNNNTWRIDGTISTTGPLIEDGTTLGGTGELVLSDSDVNRVEPENPGDIFTHGAGHTIRGAGELVDNRGGMMNLGTIIAQGTLPLILDPQDGSLIVNLGDIIAQGPGGIRLDNGDYVNTGRTLRVMGGSRLDVRSGVVLVGGTIDGAGGGLVLPSNNATFDGVAFTQGTQVEVLNGETPKVLNGLTNNARWTLMGTTGFSSISFEGGDQTLSGSGSIETTDDPQNAVAIDGGVLTHGPDHTIRGVGRLLSNSGGMVNEGTILASGSSDFEVNPSPAHTFENTGTLGGDGAFDFSDPFINAGTIAPGLPESAVAALTLRGDISSTPGATLEIQVLDALESDALVVDGTHAIDGTLVVSLTGGFEPTGAGPYEVLSATSLSGRFSNASTPVGGVVEGVVTGSVRFDVVYDDAMNRVLIDNVEAVIEPCSAADLTIDGSLDFADVSAFLTLFSAGSLDVDFDGSGSIDFGDVSAFLGLFAAGCP